MTARIPCVDALHNPVHAMCLSHMEGEGVATRQKSAAAPPDVDPELPYDACVGTETKPFFVALCLSDREGPFETVIPFTLAFIALKKKSTWR